MDFSMLVAAPLAFLVAALLLHFLTKHHRHYSSYNLPPGNLGFPVVGQTLSLLRAFRSNSDDQWFRDRIKKYGPVSSMSVLGSPTVLLAGPAANRFIFSNDGLILTQTSALRDLVGRSVLTFAGDELKQVRSALQGYLRPEMVRRYVCTMDEEVRKHIELNWVDRKTVTVLPLARSLSLGIICSVVFGQEAAPLKEALAADFVTLGKAILSFPVKIPFTRFSKGMTASAKIRKAITRIAQKREESLLQEGHAASSTDFITYMLILRSQGAHSLTLEEIVDNAMGLIIGAHETTSVLITFMIRYLANEPDVLDKITEEQDEIAGNKRREDALTWDDVARMRYTWKVLCHERALAAFGLDPACWGVNVQPYSCTSANLAVYTGLLLPKDRIMGLEPPSGGHVSHGYYTPSGKKVSGASIFFESLSYKVNPQTGYIDYDKLEERAMDFHPKILICGGSSYPREWDFARMRLIADKCGAVLMCDMAHISGLVAAKECRSPFDYCDVATTTTHKNLRGPRGGIIFFRKGKNLRKRTGSFSQGDGNDYDFEDRINFAVFPSMQGGPHNNHIAALAITLKQVATPEYKAYIQQVKKNAQALASALLRRKCRLVTGGTDNHLILWDLRNFGLTGKNFEKVCEACHISINKTPIYGDNGSISPGGVRIGTPAMTTRGCLEDDFEDIADFLIRATQIASNVLKEHGKLQKEFLRGLQNNKDIIELRNQVETFASQFAMPGFDV